jgi:hypothetical protein
LVPGAAPAATVAIPDASASDALIANVTPTSDADTRGMWGPVASWPHIAVHASLVPQAGSEGVVLTHGATVTPRQPDGTDQQAGIDYNLWDPAKGLGFDPSYPYSLTDPVDPRNPAHRLLTDPIQYDSFCSSSKLLPDGTLMIAGGNTRWYGDQTRATHAFDPAAQQLRSMAYGLAFPRWYGSLVRLPDDRMLVVGGGEAYANVGSTTPEIYSPLTGWRTLPGAASTGAFGNAEYEWWYPRAFLAPNGDVFGISRRQMWRLDVNAAEGRGAIRMMGRITTDNVGTAGSAVMYDVGRILMVGGGQLMNDFRGQRGSNEATLIDVNADQPVVAATSPMAFRRNWVNTVLLPTGDVLAGGGAEWGNADNSNAQPGNADSQFGFPAYSPEIWNRTTGRWAVGAPQQRIRVYHSTFLLLPNGTVLSAGGGVPGPQQNRNAEVYYPPYLFRRQSGTGGTVVWASRPKLVRISDNLAYGNTFRLQMGDARAIERIMFVSLGAVTHGHNNDQRGFLLQNPAVVPGAVRQFAQQGNELLVPITSDDRQLPPGWYMMHAVDSNGVPSRGYMFEIRRKP